MFVFILRRLKVVGAGCSSKLVGHFENICQVYANFWVSVEIVGRRRVL